MPDSPLARKPLYAPNGVVATSQPLAAAAGMAVLRRGGNAVDAAIATATALTVVQPGSNGIGGDLFAIVWDGTRLHGLNASGRAPAALTYERAVAAGVPPAGDGALGGEQGRAERVLPDRGWLPVTVPGAPAGWRDLHRRFGSLPFATLFEDAIGYAEGGYLVSPQAARHWDRAARVLHPTLTGPEFAEWSRVYAVAGRAPRAGELWRCPDAAHTLRLIARSGAAEFYQGGIAAAIERHAAETGGLITAADLAGHTNTWVDPISTGYRGFDVWELPPNGQGIATLIALNILDGMPLDSDPGMRTHAAIEAIKLGFADTHAYVADPAVWPVPVAELLDKRYSAARRALIGPRAGQPAAGEPSRGGTVYLCTADADGMMVSLIQSNYMGFGSHVVIPGYGFGLQNRGAGFSLVEGHPNAVAPGKRPFHTIIPAFLSRDGAAVGPFGLMGGHMQPQGHLQLLLSTIDDGLDPQAALDAPRWYWHSRRTVYLEQEILRTAHGEAVVADLRSRGHDVVLSGDSGIFGYGQAIWRLAGGYVAGSESRADGCAYGF